MTRFQTLALFVSVQTIQLMVSRMLYLNLVNMLDWFGYIAAILVVVDLTPSGLREVSIRSF